MHGGVRSGHSHCTIIAGVRVLRLFDHHRHQADDRSHHDHHHQQSAFDDSAQHHVGGLLAMEKAGGRLQVFHIDMARSGVHSRQHVLYLFRHVIEIHHALRARHEHLLEGSIFAGLHVARSAFALRRRAWLLRVVKFAAHGL